jgi:arylsulfatase A-like enzyme
VANGPNILVLMTDQQRADCMGCAGHPRIRTPNMDRLAAGGMRFTQACTSSPLCMPARASFICGRHVHSHGIWHNEGELAPDAESLFRRLQQAGYYTAHIGKSHYYGHPVPDMRAREPYMHTRGFDFVNETPGPWATLKTDCHMTDEWAEKGLLDVFRNDYRKRWALRDEAPVWPSPMPVDDYLDSYVGRKAVEFVEACDRPQPFCLFVGFGGPHEPWDAPGEYATMYRPRKMPRAIPATGKDGDPRLTRKRIAAIRASYYGKISLIDRWVGEILDACERRGVFNDLFVVFWSDHGEMAGDHGRLYKSCFYEGALRVPLIFRLPGRIKAGATSDALTATVDLMPTILEAAGVPVPDTCEGASLWPVLQDPCARVRDEVLSEISTEARCHTMIRTAREKYAVHEDGTPYLLYDLSADPEEQENLVGRPGAADREQALRQRLLELVDAVPPTGPER